MMSSKFISFLSILLCGVLAGCKHYHLGDPCSQALPFNCVYVKPVDNQSTAPQVHALLTEQVTRLLHQSNAQTCACPEDADASLVILVTDYSKTKATSLDNDTELASSFYIKLTASVSLIDNTTGCYYFKDRIVSENIHGLSDVSLQAVTYQDMPVLTRKLAQKIRNLVIDTW